MICTPNSAISVATLNVRGFNTRKKQYQVQRLLQTQKPDFLALQETKMAEEEQVFSAVQPFCTRMRFVLLPLSGSRAVVFYS